MTAITLPSFLRERQYLANATAHFTVDILNGSIPLLITVYTLPMGLGYAWIGFISILYTAANSLTQPIFGWLADTHGVRIPAAGGVIWVAVFFALSLLAQGWFAIGFLILAGLGSASFHPPGVTVAGSLTVRQVATATAVFFLFGQMGLGIGPALSGIILDVWGQYGLLILPLAILLAGLWLLHSLQGGLSGSPQHEEAATSTRLRYGPVALVMFGVLLFTRMTVQATTVTYLPKYLQSEGWDVAASGVGLSAIMIGSAIGGVIGGSLADLRGRRKVVAGSMFLAAIPLWFYLDTSGIVFFVMLFAIGLLTGAGFSVTVVMAQGMIPGRKSFASGLTMGFIFASGAVGAAIAGWIGDQIGMDVVLQSMAVVAVIAGLCALALPTTQSDPPTSAV